jgi:Holliday junction resolvase RusA-like endonuclease
MEAQGRPVLSGPVALEVAATFSLPVSKPRWWKSAALAGRIAHTTKPDGDNVLKAAKDALNGIAWLDDAQVIAATITKRYGDQPAVEITVRPLAAARSQDARREDVA